MVPRPAYRYMITIACVPLFNSNYLVFKMCLHGIIKYDYNRRKNIILYELICVHHLKRVNKMFSRKCSSTLLIIHGVYIIIYDIIIYNNNKGYGILRQLYYL